METVTIPKKRYESLLWSEKVLRFLEANGVDNWEGYRLPPIEGEEDDF